MARSEGLWTPKLVHSRVVKQVLLLCLGCGMLPGSGGRRRVSEKEAKAGGHGGAGGEAIKDVQGVWSKKLIFSCNKVEGAYR